MYEKDLTTGTETRITFQNGDVSHPSYHPHQNLILYASSTDELKENPPLLRSSQEGGPLPEAYRETSEVYLHSLDGLEITRLTDRPGFDGEPRFSPDGRTITWTRARNNKLEVISFNPKSRVTSVVTKLGSNPSQFTTSADGKWRAWVDWDDSFGIARLKIQNGKNDPQEININMVVPKQDPEFSSDSKWLFWAQFDPEASNHQIWTLELGTMCARRLINNKKGDRRHPILSPDMKRLVYTVVSKTESKSRIAQMGFLPPTGPCEAKP